MNTVQTPAHRAGISKTFTLSHPGSKPSRHIGRSLVHGRDGRNMRPDKHNDTVDLVEYERPLRGLGVSEGIWSGYSKSWSVPYYSRSHKMTNRWDETWHRLREWTNGQAQSERLAAQILIDAEYDGIDPSHPLGGKDGGKDALCSKQGKKWIMAVYFPRGQKDFAEIRTKFEGDLPGALKNGASGIAFVTNQEIRLAEREKLRQLAGEIELDLFHLERITAALDKPSMASVRHQFLRIESVEASSVSALRDEISKMQQRLEGLQTGGDSFCYLMLYHFDLQKNIAQNFVVIRKGKYPLYDVRLRILNMNTGAELNKQWGEISAPAEFNLVKWPLSPHEYYRVFIHARNGQYHQDLQLRRSNISECWLAATRVTGTDGTTVRLQHIDGGYESEFGAPAWI